MVFTPCNLQARQFTGRRCRRPGGGSPVPRQMREPAAGS